MSKFQVGDIVVGNEKAKWYGITRAGCVVRVTVVGDKCHFRGVLLKPSPDRGRGSVGVEFSLQYERFDLKESVIQENE